MMLDRISGGGYYVRMSGRRVRATNLEAVILNQGRTKKWVADHGGFSQSMLSHLLAGRKTIAADAADRIATALGVPVFVLFESADAEQMSAITDREEVVA